MQLLDELEAEHDLIERAAGSFLTFAAIPPGARDRADGAAFLRFFRVFANHFHHAREEDILFAALRERAGLPGDRGPIAAMIADHQRMAGLLADMAAIIERPESGEADERFQQRARTYVHSLWHHIDAENSVLFPECGPRLRRNGVLELPSRDLSDDERDARSAGESLVARYPPAPSDDAMRGDGCIMCPAFGVTCRGLELEWWNEWEWDEFEDRMSGG
jgi:hemerythrin-like domain-containing protein